MADSPPRKGHMTSETFERLDVGVCKFERVSVTGGVGMSMRCIGVRKHARRAQNERSAETLTSENVPFQVLVASERLTAVRAEDHIWISQEFEHGAKVSRGP